MLGRFGKPDKAVLAAGQLYDALVGRAREPVFYTRFSVPDTVDGRFDLLAIHAFLVMDALKERGAEGSRIGTSLATLIFAGFDDALRELGVGDLGISRRIKAMANAFYGRLEAYRSAKTEVSLGSALVRNLYRGDESHGHEAKTLARYILSAGKHLRGQADVLLEGTPDFGALPEP